MWEMKLLDDKKYFLKMSLWDAMMTLFHPTKKKFNLFYSLINHV